MSLSSSIISLITEDTGGGSAVTTDGELVTPVDYSNNTETLATGKGVDQNIGYAVGLGFEFHTWSVFAALKTKMLADTPVLLRVKYDGSTNNQYSYDPVYFSIVPRLGSLPDKCALYIAAKNTDHVSNVPTAGAPWTSLGLILGGSGPQFSPVTVEDGCKHPVYSRTTLQWEVDFLAECSAALDTYRNTGAKLAIAHPDGTFTYIDNVRAVNLPSAGELVMTRAVFSGAWRDVIAADETSDGVTPPASPDDYFFGCLFAGIASGTQQSDVLTIATA